MKTKYLLIPMVVAVLVFSSIAMANSSKEIETPALNFRDGIYKRVIADNINESSVKFFEGRGCFLKHRLKRFASFECPKDLVPELNVRESRIFYIMDIGADQQTGADKVWAEGITGSGVKVAVLDTGIDTDHPELQDSYLGGYDYVNNDPYPEDDHGHGTHVAGIITSNGINDASSKGAAPGAGIYMYKVCSASGSCYEDDMIAAMEAAAQTDAKVMSISIGGGSYTAENCDSDTLAAKVNWVADQGLTVVVAAGNNGKGVSSPGCASKAIAVGAVDKTNNVPYWSGRGKALDIASPGVSIYSSVIGGYGYMSGTSMATPNVAGIAALLLQANPGLTAGEIKTALYSTANPASKCYRCTSWLGSSCYSQSQVACTQDITGAGVVNAYEAYLSVKPEAVNCSSDAECDDGLYCNGAEACQAGICQAGISVDCSGLNGQCNAGVCDEATDSCASQPANEGKACDDGVFCNAGETCQAGACAGGSARTCSDGNSCTIDSCDEAAGSCINAPVADGESCDDGKFCTIVDACAAGTCGGTARDCSDSVSCTVDSCNEANDTCANTPDNSLCSDGIFCNGAEVCYALSGCKAVAPLDCNDGSECTADSCNEGIGACEHVNAADNTACAGGLCCSGTCISPACSSDSGCNDSKACTEDACSNPGTCSASCSYAPITACASYDGCCPAGCDNTNDNDCPAATKCWSAQYKYLYPNSNQARKFCKCAQGTYSYSSYSYNYGRKTVYRYANSGNNQNWAASAISSSLPVYRVKCADGNWYSTSQDYYR